MTSYIKLSTGEYPRYEGDIRLEHPEITEDQTYPNFPCPSTYAPVVMDEMPQFNNETHSSELLYPENINGVWRARWSPIRPFSPAELSTQARIKAHEESLRPGASLRQNLDATGSAPNVIG